MVEFIGGSARNRDTPPARGYNPPPSFLAAGGIPHGTAPPARHRRRPALIPKEVLLDRPDIHIQLPTLLRRQPVLALDLAQQPDHGERRQRLRHAEPRSRHRHLLARATPPNIRARHHQNCCSASLEALVYGSPGMCQPPSTVES